MIIGNLGAGPEMTYTGNGNVVTKFTVAVNEQWSDQSGERKTRTEWFSVVTWNRTAENCAQYLRKGAPVYVEGRMQTRSWEGQDGAKHYKTELIGDRVVFLVSGDGKRDPRPPEPRAESGDIDPDDLPF